MASSKIFQTSQISFSIMLLTLFFILLLHKVNSIETTYFSITKFVSDQKNIIFQGDGSSTSTGSKLQLTDASPYAIGRALYSAPIHIWDSETGKVGNFETHFNFLITAPNVYRNSDGLAFFLAPVDTQPQSGGGYLGIFNDGNYNKSYQTVAVEFDTYYNSEWDENNGKHIGIDVNCIRSIKTTPWCFRNGKEANVVIRFNGDTKLLSVTLTYDDNVSYRVSDYVDLKDVLPEWVRVGFSAATGSLYSATHSILSWSFASELTHGNSTSMQLQAKLPYSFAI